MGLKIPWACIFKARPESLEGAGIAIRGGLSSRQLYGGVFDHRGSKRRAAPAVKIG